MPNTNDDNTNTLTETDGTSRNPVHSQIAFILPRNAWAKDEGKRFTTDISDASVLTQKQARDLADTYPPNDVLIFDTQNGGRFEVLKRVLVAGYKALGLDTRPMMGSVGSDQAGQRQQQSNR